MNLRQLLLRKQRVDRGALNRAMSQPLPELAREIPFDTPVPLPPATSGMIGHVGFLVFIYVVAWLWAGAGMPTPFELLVVAAAIALEAASLLASDGLNPTRRLYLSEQGARVDRVMGSQTAAWWDVAGVRAKPDLSEIRIDTRQRSAVVNVSAMDEPQRAAVLTAIRARLDPAQPIQEWSPHFFSRELFAKSSAVAGSIFVVISMYLVGAIDSPGVLGMRCSGPSSYLDARFGLPPDRPGCVVLRVSGPAARAGVRLGDRLVEMNNAPITSGSQFNDRFFDEKDDQFDLTLFRSGAESLIHVHVALGTPSSHSTSDEDPIAWFLRARGNPSVAQSIRQYSRAIELAPDFDLAYLFRGELQLESDPAAASVDFEKALQLNPQSARAHFAVAAYYQPQIFVDPAVPKLHLRRAIELDGCEGGFVGTNVDCEIDFAALADLLRFRADTPGSIEAAKTAMTYYPKASWPLYQLALSYEIAGDKLKAETYAGQYLASSATDKSTVGVTKMKSLLDRVTRAERG
jgi:hypothetical protein